MKTIKNYKWETGPMQRKKVSKPLHSSTQTAEGKKEGGMEEGRYGLGDPFY